MKKAVKDLQPGDVVTVEGLGTKSSQIILAVHPTKGASHAVFEMYSLERGEVWKNATPVSGDMIVDVKGEPRATPEDLDTLLTIARAYVANVPPSITSRQQAQDLVNKLSPPNPPTYEELLDVVRRMCEPPRAYAEGQPTPFSECAKLAERARHAGILK